MERKARSKWSREIWNRRSSILQILRGHFPPRAFFRSIQGKRGTPSGLHSSRSKWRVKITLICRTCAPLARFVCSVGLQRKRLPRRLCYCILVSYYCKNTLDEKANGQYIFHLYTRSSATLRIQRPLWALNSEAREV